ncbi:MAG: hypothetical protein ACLTSO_07320 [Coprococcus sp.]
MILETEAGIEEKKLFEKVKTEALELQELGSIEQLEEALNSMSGTMTSLQDRLIHQNSILLNF